MIRPLFSLILCLSVVASSGQQPLVKHYWLNDKEVPVAVRDIVQDSIGYIWLGTEQGLFRYNGLEFVAIADTFQSGISTLLFTGNRLFLGYEKGILASVINSRIKVERSAATKNKMPITCIAQDDQQNLWIGSEDGINIWKGKQSQYISIDQGLSDNFIYNIRFTPEHLGIIGTDKGLNILRTSANPAVNAVIDIRSGLADNIISALSSSGIKDTYWVGTSSGGICLVNISTKKIQHAVGYKDWQWGTVKEIRALGSNRAFSVTDKGYLIESVINRDQSVTSRIYATLGAPAHSLYIDKTGNIWCGTSNGLTLVLTESLSYIPLAAPYQTGTLTAMACDRDNTLWIALGRHLYQLPAGSRMLQKVWEAPALISYLCTGKDRLLWIGTMGSGLWYRTGTHMRIQQAPPEHLKNASVLCIAERYNELWLGGLNGIHVLDSALHVIQHFNKASGTGSDYIYSLFKDSRNNMWIASDGGGISMYHNSTIRSWPSLNKGSAAVAYSITEDLHGNIWYADLESNLHRFSNENWRHFVNEKPIVKGNELSLLTTNVTGLIISVFRDRIDYLSDRPNAHWHFEIGNWLENDSFSHVLNCFTKDTAGNIYLPVSSGLLVINNSRGSVAPVQNVIIQKITNNGNEITATKHQFKAGENYFTFLFDAVFFSDSKKYYYRYKLDGLNNNWVHSTINLATFSNLPTGKYTFIVQASSDEYFNNISEKAYHFEILLPFWKKWWFIALLVLLLSSSILIYNRIRINNLKRIASIEHEKLFFEYEYLRSQINPHFLFNSLNTLTSIIDEHPEKAIVYTEKLSDFYRNTINRLDKNIISVQEELDILENYVQIQQYRFGHYLQVQIEIGEADKTKKIIPMALQFLVENAIKHNVISGENPLIITIMIKGKYLVVSNRINLKRQVFRSSKLGLSNIGRRYTLHSNKKIEYGAHEGYWIVRLPLIE